MRPGTNKLYSNAGIALGAEISISKTTPKEWSDQVCDALEVTRNDTLISFLQFNVNVIELVFFTIAILPLMEKSDEKRVVNITSMLGDVEYTLANPHLQFVSYSVTKASVTMVNAKFHAE